MGASIGRSQADRMKSRHERGYGNAWDKLRKRILHRDNYICQSCKGMGMIRRATDVDHITRKADGGTDSPDNLQALCKTCHDDKTRAENGDRPLQISGCNANGIPIDPQHHWGNGWG